MPWMANGTVLSYLSTHRHDAIRLVSLLSYLLRDNSKVYTLQLFQVAQAVAFMHDLGIVHADLRGVRPSLCVTYLIILNASIG